MAASCALAALRGSLPEERVRARGRSVAGAVFLAQRACSVALPRFYVVGPFFVSDTSPAPRVRSVSPHRHTQNTESILLVHLPCCPLVATKLSLSLSFCLPLPTRAEPIREEQRKKATRPRAHSSFRLGLYSHRNNTPHSTLAVSPSCAYSCRHRVRVRASKNIGA